MCGGISSLVRNRCCSGIGVKVAWVSLGTDVRNRPPAIVSGVGSEAVHMPRI